jgi:cell division protein FtsQ
MSTDLRVRPRPPGRPAPDRLPHPRMRARRVEVARDAGRRRLRRVNVVLAVVCAVVWSLVVLRSPLLDVDRVQVVGAESTADADALAASGIDTGEPLVGVDLDGAEAALADLPWVDEARVSRLWPGTVRIVLTERTPLATQAHAGGWAVVDAQGRVLAVVAERPDLVLLDGHGDAAPGGRLSPAERSVLRTLIRLPDGVRAEVTGAAAGPDGQQVTLESGELVVLGDGSSLAAKLAAADAVAADAAPEDGCRIDVRVPTAPVLTMDGSCA